MSFYTILIKHSLHFIQKTFFIPCDMFFYSSQPFKAKKHTAYKTAKRTKRLSDFLNIHTLTYRQNGGIIYTVHQKEKNMKIVDIKTENIKIPLVTPFKTALRTTDCVDDIIVRVITDTGEVGYGEAPPTAVITGDTKASIAGAIEDFIRPSIIGFDIEDLDGIMKKLHGCIKKNTSAKAAVDMAVYDLFAKKCKMPLYKVLGGGRSVITTDLTISVNPVDVMVNDAKKAVEDGFKTLKIKVGKDGRGDVERMKAIRDAVVFLTHGMRSRLSMQ